MLKMTIRDTDLMPNVNAMDNRPLKDLVLKKDWGVEDTGAILVQLGNDDRLRLAIPIDEVIRHAAAKHKTKPQLLLPPPSDDK